MSKKKPKFVEYYIDGLFDNFKLYGEFICKDEFGNMPLKIKRWVALDLWKRPQCRGLFYDHKWMWTPESENVKVCKDEIVVPPLD